MSRKTIYFHHSFLVFAILLILLVGILALVFVGVIGVAFSNIGFTPVVILLILVGTLLGSAINIPLFKLKTTVPMIQEAYLQSVTVSKTTSYHHQEHQLIHIF